MIERKTMWAVTHDLQTVKKDVIVEDGNVLASKNAESGGDFHWPDNENLHYFEKEGEAIEFAHQERVRLLTLVPMVKNAIRRFESDYVLRKVLGIERRDYLGSYSTRCELDQYMYKRESEYAAKLEVFIKKGMLNIGDKMIPVGAVRCIQWYGKTHADEGGYGDWKAVLTTTDGVNVATHSTVDVRLVWTIFGRCTGSYDIDDSIDYEDEENE